MAELLYTHPGCPEFARATISTASSLIVSIALISNSEGAVKLVLLALFAVLPVPVEVRFGGMVDSERFPLVKMEKSVCMSVTSNLISTY